ncbi:MAG: hypothetical protein FGM33_00965 [Candidatus Kapabacteria bacterium]|nr:hypothetical protein [Candidatus Kapabacteria bacterium]
MIRNIVIIGALLCIPVIIYMALYHGQPPSVTFSEAIVRTQHTSESDPASKVLVEAEVVEVESTKDLMAKDASGEVFHIEYTGNEPAQPFVAGAMFRFVGHVHGGEPPLFHATQALAK